MRVKGTGRAAVVGGHPRWLACKGLGGNTLCRKLDALGDGQVKHARLGLAATFAALALSSPAFGQDASGEKFASYALDFCAAFVDGADIAAAHAAASPRAGLDGPKPAGDDADLVGRSIKADRETPIVILGPPDNSRRNLMAFARADASHCMTFAGEGEDSLDALHRRLANDASGWQAEMETSGVRAYERAAANGKGGLTLFAIAARPGEVARIIVERGEAPVTILTQEQRAAWARHVVAQCAVAIHNNQDPAADLFKPYFKLSQNQVAGSIALDQEDGQPAGIMFLEKGGRPACLLTIASGGILDLERAVQEALTEFGAKRQANGHYRLKKPKGAKGRDAVFEVSRIPMLMVRASKG